MARYAADTSVPADRSRAEIERTLQRYGASSFVYGWGAKEAVIMFEAHERRIKFVLPLPARDDYRFTHTAQHRSRSETAAQTAWEQACRQSWRALALVIKAKLEAVAAGITEFEDEFLAHILLPSGQTFGEWARPQIAIAYEINVMPALMPGAD